MRVPGQSATHRERRARRRRGTRRQTEHTRIRRQSPMSAPPRSCRTAGSGQTTRRNPSRWVRHDPLPVRRSIAGARSSPSRLQPGSRLRSPQTSGRWSGTHLRLARGSAGRFSASLLFRAVLSMVGVTLAPSLVAVARVRSPDPQASERLAAVRTVANATTSRTRARVYPTFRYPPLHNATSLKWQCVRRAVAPACIPLAVPSSLPAPLHPPLLQPPPELRLRVRVAAAAGCYTSLSWRFERPHVTRPHLRADVSRSAL